MQSLVAVKGSGVVNLRSSLSVLVMTLLCSVAASARADSLIEVSVSDKPASPFAQMFAHTLPLQQTASGSLLVHAHLAGIRDEFLLDTGANMITINQGLYKQLARTAKLKKTREIGARLASGRIEILPVYLVQHFSLGNGCDLGPVEVAVVSAGKRNLLGMNALQLAAPFAISTTPPELGLSRCSATAY